MFTVCHMDRSTWWKVACKGKLHMMRKHYLLHHLNVISYKSYQINMTLIISNYLREGFYKHMDYFRYSFFFKMKMKKNLLSQSQQFFKAYANLNVVMEGGNYMILDGLEGDTRIYCPRCYAFAYAFMFYIYNRHMWVHLFFIISYFELWNMIF